MSITVFFPFEIFADVYYVSQAGAGNRSGSSFENRATVVNHNAGMGYFVDLDGDTVVLCGRISTALKVPDGGTSGHIVTYDGNAASYDQRATNATITNFSRVAGYSSFYIYSKEYVTVKNVKIDWNYTSEMGSSMDNVWGLRIQNSNNIIIDSADISETHNGIAIHDNSYNIRIVKSIINKIAESGIYISRYSSSNHPHDITIGGKYEDGNTVKNCTYKTRWDNNRVGYDIRLGPDVENITISYNHLYSDTEYHGMSAILVHSCQNILIEYNTIHDHQSFNHRPAISVKGEERSALAYNIVIRYNKIYNEKSDSNSYVGTTKAILFSGNWKHAYVYGNYISSCGGGINANFAYWINPPTHSDGVNPGNMHIWSNVIYNTSGTGISIGGAWQGTDLISDVFIVNNTLYRVALSTQSKTGAGISNSLTDTQDYNINIKNNIIMDARIEANDQFTLYSEPSLDRFTENNTYFISNTTYNEKLKSKYSNEEIENPLFLSTNKGALLLSENSPCKDSGLSIVGPTNVPADVVSLAGEINYEDALDPVKTDWTTIPPRVYKLKQSDYGAGWEKGAYVYVTNSSDTRLRMSLSKPLNISVSPVN